MTVVDVNVLLYAANRSSLHHRAAREWLDLAVSRRETLGFPWIVLSAFLRLSTRPGPLPNPLPLDRAFGVVAGLLERPQVRVLTETEDHFDHMRRLLTATGVGGNLTTDAHLAALALSYGAALVSFDHDFGRFPGLRWVNPASPH